MHPADDKPLLNVINFSSHDNINILSLLALFLAFTDLTVAISLLDARLTSWPVKVFVCTVSLP